MKKRILHTSVDLIRTNTMHFGTSLLVSFTIILMFLIAGCEEGLPSDDDIGIETAAQPLSAANSRILGFENHQDWSNVSSNSETHSQGSYSASVDVAGWTVLKSVSMSSLGFLPSEVSVDVLLPQETPNWGEVQIVVEVPSHNLWYAFVGSQTTMGLTAQEFHKFTFPLSGNIASTMATEYSDLSIQVIINAPEGNYLVDNLVFLSNIPVYDPGDPVGDPSGPVVGQNYRSEFYDAMLNSSTCKIEGSTWNLPSHSCANAILKRMEQEYPDLVRVQNIGRTTEGRVTSAVRIGTSDYRTYQGKKIPKPVVLLDAAVHGFERHGTPILLDWMDFLLNPNHRASQAYPSTPDDAYHPYFSRPDWYFDDNDMPGQSVTHETLLNNWIVWIVPIANPDGYVEALRGNAEDVDINRDCSYRWKPGIDNASYPMSQPETRALLNFAETIQPNVYMSIHGWNNGVIQHSESRGKLSIPSTGDNIDFLDEYIDGAVGSNMVTVDTVTNDVMTYTPPQTNNNFNLVAPDDTKEEDFYHYTYRNDANNYPSMPYLAENTRFEETDENASAVGLENLYYSPLDDSKLFSGTSNKWNQSTNGPSQTFGYIAAAVGAVSIYYEIPRTNKALLSTKVVDEIFNQPTCMTNGVGGDCLCELNGSCRCIDNDPADGDCDCIDLDDDGNCDPVDVKFGGPVGGADADKGACESRCPPSDPSWHKCKCLDSDGDNYYDCIDLGTWDSDNNIFISDGLCDSYVYPTNADCCDNDNEDEECACNDYCSSDGACACIDIDGNGVCDCIDFNGDGRCETKIPANHIYKLWHETRSEQFIRMVLEDNFYVLNRFVVSANNPYPGQEPDQIAPTYHHNLAVTDVRIPHQSCDYSLLDTFWRNEQLRSNDPTWLAPRNGYYGTDYNQVQCTVSNWGNEASENFTVRLSVTDLDNNSTVDCEMNDRTGASTLFLDHGFNPGVVWQSVYYWDEVACGAGQPFLKDRRYRVTCRVIPDETSSNKETESAETLTGYLECEALEDANFESPYYCADNYTTINPTYNVNNDKTVEFKAVLNADVIGDYECTTNNGVKPEINLNGIPTNHIVPIVTI